jgi:pimeloyl-ACP methyl ester carboxylesterase
LSAALERQRFGNTLPVHWWDQPHIDAEVAAPFKRLVDAAEKELGRLFDAQEKPVALLANSFGVHVALALIERVPEKLGQLHVLGGTLNMRAAFVRLGKHIAKANRDSGLGVASLSAERSVDSESLWKLIESLFAVSNLLDFYWGPDGQEQSASMKELAAKGLLMHAATFGVVLRDVLTQPGPSSSQFAGPVRVLIGRYDPYAQPDDEELWRAVFPRASVEFVEAGHFPHLELPIEVWMPSV